MLFTGSIGSLFRLWLPLIKDPERKKAAVEERMRCFKACLKLPKSLSIYLAKAAEDRLTTARNKRSMMIIIKYIRIHDKIADN